tara:strand:+ start:338 stop:514 length:177 start_codon:yes stop_codon:yes gene_type:complete
MSVSEYEFFGVTDYENAKNTRDRISTRGREAEPDKKREEGREGQRYEKILFRDAEGYQ